MKKWIKQSIMLLLVTAFALQMFGCGSKQEASSETGTHLNIAIQPVPGYVPLYVLRDKGWLTDALKEDSVDINFTEFESGPPENESFAAGQQDIGVMGNVPSISGIAAGQNRSIIGISYNGEQANATLVAKDSSIQSIEDLKGKKVGLVVGSIAENLLNTQLQSVGLTEKDVELVNLSTGEQATALTQGQVDAVTTWEPSITKIQSSGDTRILADGTGLFKGENTIVADASYVKEHPQIVKTFLEQYKKAAKEVKEHPDEIAKTYAKQFGVSEEEFVSALSHVEFPIAITEDDVADLQKTADFLYESGTISQQLQIKDYVSSHLI